MEIDQKPDTYVKTVLTFGNKPARAMAQIVFRKIAAEGETSSLSAAKTLKKKKNSNMDDILDSVQTVSEAWQLTTEIDEVLAKGGFTTILKNGNLKTGR